MLWEKSVSILDSIFVLRPGLLTFALRCGNRTCLFTFFVWVAVLFYV